MKKTYLITGGTGFLGSHIIKTLLAQGGKVYVLSRNAGKVKKVFSDTVTGITSLDELKSDVKIDVIINLAGATLFSFWTKKRKKEFFSSRVGTTIDLVELIKRLDNKPELFISGSAIGYYGDCGDESVAEGGPPKDDLMSKLCQAWEAEALKTEGVRLVLLRTGLVLDGSGGFMEPMLMSTKLFAGLITGGGHYLSWIDLKDFVSLIKFIINNSKCEGAINATAPNPVTQRQFMKKLGKVLKRPVFLYAPVWLIKLFLGEMAYLFVNGQRVIPKNAEELGFEFKYRDIEQSFKRIVGRDNVSGN